MKRPIFMIPSHNEDGSLKTPEQMAEEAFAAIQGYNMERAVEDCFAEPQESTCRHCETYIQRVDGEWFDIEENPLCEPDGPTDRHHEPIDEETP
jgi:hypothetical protein